MLIHEIVLWMIIPLLNFFFFYSLGYSLVPFIEEKKCFFLPEQERNEEINLKIESERERRRIIDVKEEKKKELFNQRKYEINVQSMEAKQFQKHRGNLFQSLFSPSSSSSSSTSFSISFLELRIVKLGYHYDTLILNLHPTASTPCFHIANNLVEESENSCSAIIYDNSLLIENSPPLLRFEKENTSSSSSSSSLSSLKFQGFFSKPGNFKGRNRFIDKLNPLLRSLVEVEREMDNLLLERGIGRGDDLVVMVVNAGELDLFLNFACSCRLHNISLYNMLVFAASRLEINPNLSFSLSRALILSLSLVILLFLVILFH